MQFQIFLMLLKTKKSKAKFSAAPPDTEVRKKIKLDHSDLHVINPLWEPTSFSDVPAPAHATPDITDVSGSGRAPSTSITSAGVAVPAPAHATPAVTSGSGRAPSTSITSADVAVPAPAHATPDITSGSGRAPSTSITSADVAVPAPAHVTPAVINDDPVPAGVHVIAPVTSDISAIELSDGAAPTSTPQPGPLPALPLAPASNPSVESAARAALIQSAFPPRVPAPQIPAAAVLPVPAASVSVAQGPKMTATSILTSRNLCAQDWIKRYKGTRAAFAIYWGSILGTAEEERWKTASHNAKVVAGQNYSHRDIKEVVAPDAEREHIDPAAAASGDVAAVAGGAAVGSGGIEFVAWQAATSVWVLGPSRS
ncbi:hypothetical protein B0H11DRAFT_1937454 [Mycena galericulata]|nr:hypothetical protein B0H11DRAFT_1937454 [Mycena galericulata]